MKHLQLYTEFINENIIQDLPKGVERVDSITYREFLIAGDGSDKTNIDTAFSKEEQEQLMVLAKLARKAISGLPNEILIDANTRVLFRKNLAAPDGLVYGLTTINSNPANPGGESEFYLARSLDDLSLVVIDLAKPEIEWVEIK